jgi:hypothetical protein
LDRDNLPDMAANDHKKDGQESSAGFCQRKKLIIYNGSLNMIQFIIPD